MAEDLIRMEHINKFYGRVQALDDVNLTVDAQRDRRPARRQRRGQVDADQGAVRRRAARPAATSIVRGRTRRHPQHDGRDRAGHRDDLPGFGAGHAALDRAQSVPRPRADQGPALPQPHGHSADGEGRRRPAASRSASASRSRPRRRSPRCRAASARRWRSRARCISTATSSSSTSRPTISASRRRRACCASCATRAIPAIPASSSRTTSTTSSRWSTASSVMRRGKIVADDIDPKQHDGRGGRGRHHRRAHRARRTDRRRPGSRRGLRA